MQKALKTEKTTAALAALLLTAALLLGSIADYALRCRSVRENVVRLHITANSDTTADQTVKLLVRDAVLEAGAAVFSGAGTKAEAERAIAAALPELIQTAEAVLRENGFSYGAAAEIATEYFDTREYDGVTLPAGKYTAVRLKLGSGKGQNWWCVMFPPLCLPAAEKNDSLYAVWNDAGTVKVTDQQNGCTVKFKIVEWFEQLRGNTRTESRKQR
ncbi:MAG: stage II sporulation protein R [Clostridia bacterium]|nr:stage II sporulation protein R [Clostridia bacterium]